MATATKEKPARKTPAKPKAEIPPRPKRRIRLSTQAVKNPNTGETELLIRAETLTGKKLIATGSTEADAKRALEVKVAESDQRDAVRRNYPKFEEVDW